MTKTYLYFNSFVKVGIAGKYQFNVNANNRVYFVNEIPEDVGLALDELSTSIQGQEPVYINETYFDTVINLEVPSDTYVIIAELREVEIPAQLTS